MPYQICTDSSCDLPPSYLDAHPLKVVGLCYSDGKNQAVDDNFRHTDAHEFYQNLRQGVLYKTTLVNEQRYLDFFRPMLEEGKDILYIGFSSALSGCMQCANLAANQLCEEYPRAKIHVVDSLSASMGLGLLVHHALANQEKGMSVEDNAAWAENNKLKVCHQFTVDNLNFLRRGGRVNMATAIIGSVLAIKPVMHMPNDGTLVATGTVRGRKQSLKALVNDMALRVIHPEEQDIFITHGDCLSDAQYLGQLIKERFAVRSITYHHVGPVIGSHAGPGCVALFYMGEYR